jgi:hypothetical protein
MNSYSVTWDYELEGGHTILRSGVVDADTVEEAEVFAARLSEAYERTLTRKATRVVTSIAKIS